MNGAVTLGISAQLHFYANNNEIQMGKTGTIKIVNTCPYMPLPKDKATIVYGNDW